MFVVLLMDEDLSGSLDPLKANAHDLEVYGPFETEADAFWFIENEEDHHTRWLCQIHEMTPPTTTNKER